MLIVGSGLIASYSARMLLEGGARVVVFSPHASRNRLRSILGPLADRCVIEQGDVRLGDRLNGILDFHGIERILHAGGLGGSRVAEFPREGFEVNVGGTLALLQAAHAAGGVARVVLVSSIFVYRTDPPLPPPAVETLPYHLPSNLYSAYKSAAEITARAFARHVGLHVVNCRVAGAYGRGEFSGGGETGGLLQGLLIRALTETPGTPIRASFRAGERVYARDVADALVRALLVKDLSHDVYNVGSGEIVGPVNFAEAVNASIPGSNVVPEETGPADTPLVDLTRSRDQLGYQPQWPLLGAIPDFIHQLRAEGIGAH